LYNELKTYFDNQLSKLEIEEEKRITQKPKEAKKSQASQKPENKSQIETQKEIQTQAKDIFSSIETKITFLKQNKDFRAYINCFENKQID